MKLIWHGHSCFTLETALGSLVLDPYQDGSVPGLPPLRLRADRVLCSHGHHDHNARELVTLTGQDCKIHVETIPCWHDDRQGRLRGENTIHLLEAEGLRVAHLGDLGHMLPAQAADRLRGVDALLIPVGGYYTIDAAGAKAVVDAVSPRVTVPMHYRRGAVGYDVISELAPFTRLFDNVVEYDTDTLELTANTPAQIAVLCCVHE